MMIKNFLVKTKQIRNSGIKYKYSKIKNSKGSYEYKRKEGSGRRVNNGFINHVNYLKDNNRPAHKNTKITVLLNNAQNILNAIEERKTFRKRKGLVGAGVVNFCTSMIFVIPNTINQPNNQGLKEWSRIGSRVIFDISKVTGIPFEIIKKHTHIVLHDESVSQDKHSHIHVLVSNVINNEVVKAISQRKTTHAVKMGFNKSVKLVLNEDHKKYIPKNINKPDKPLWLARQEKNIVLENKAKKLDEEINQKKIKLLKVNKVIALLAHKLLSVKTDISAWADDFLNNCFAQAEEKAKSVVKVIDDIESIAEAQAAELDETVRKVEERNKSAPAETKISPKRKKRRRKNKNT
jgi:hypothetical protein